MKKIFLLNLALLLMIFKTMSQTPDCPIRQDSYIYHSVSAIDNTHETGWKPIQQFSDEFDGNASSPNSSKWWLYNDYCYTKLKFSDQNMPIVNGKLRMKVTNIPQGFVCNGHTYHYKTGGMTTASKFHYGYVETQVKFPQDPNFRFEFWMMWSDYQTYYDEIDGIEFDENDNSSTFTHSLHYNDQLPGITPNNVWSHDILSETHMGKTYLFAIEWLPNEVLWYINGWIVFHKKFTNDPTCWICPENEFACSQYASSHPQVIEITNSWFAGEPRDASQYYEIDFVHSYKLEDGIYSYWPNSFVSSDNQLFKVNANLHLGGDNKTAVVPSDGTKYTVWASESIILDKGFSTNLNSKFTARIITKENDLFNQPNYPVDNRQNGLKCINCN